MSNNSDAAIEARKEKIARAERVSAMMKEIFEKERVALVLSALNFRPNGTTVPVFKLVVTD